MLNRLKKLLSVIPNWLLLPILGLVVLATWPVMIVLIGLYSLFSSKSSDIEKIAGAKMAIITILGIVTFMIYAKFSYTISIYLSFVESKLLVFAFIGIFILALLQKILPSWKLIQPNTEKQSI